MNETAPDRGRRRDRTNEEVVFTGSAFADLVASVGYLPPETGGLLLGLRHDFVVRKFVFDQWGSRSYSSYDPDVKMLNKIVKREWEENGLQLIGWAHSHPRGVDRLSGDYGGGTGDIGYLRRIFDAIPALSRFIVPILFSSHDGPLSVYPFIAQSVAVHDYRLGRLKIIGDRPDREMAEEKSEDTAKAAPPAGSEAANSKTRETQNEPSHRSISISA